MKTVFYLVVFLVIELKANAQTTYVPDDNFEQALIDLGYDDVLDDYVLTANINSITTLSVNNRSISDLTGIEDFTALESLHCGQNNLTNLNISSNIALNNLYCYNNNLTSLDVSSNIALINLHCDSNNLTSLDVSSNISLEILLCYGNNITHLDVSNNTNLRKLECNDNNLTTLNVKNGNNQNIGPFDFITVNNPDLTCIQVDDVTYSSINWTFIDPQQYFSEDCSLGIEDYNTENLSVFPNPVKNHFQIESEIPIQKIIIRNSIGKIVAEFHSQETYDVANLNKGIYFVTVSNKSKQKTLKLIVCNN